jgi:hypothetical protein
MKFAEAIAAIGTLELENKDEILKALNSRAKEFTAIEQKNQSLEQSINAILEASGAEGDDLSKRLESAQAKIGSLNEAQKTYEKSLQDTKAELTSLKRASKVQSLASEKGANFEVLTQLLANKELDEDGKIEGKDIKEYAETNWKPFIPALFPTEATKPEGVSRPPSLPGGGAKGQPTTKEDTVSTYLSTNYAIPDYLKV